MLGLFKRRTLSAAARTLGQAGASARIDAERARRRAMTDAIRADLRAKGRTDMAPVDWDSL